jgi:hypothetical protein
VNKNKNEVILCGDIFLENFTKKQQLDNLLNTYNLTSTVNFPTRVTSKSTTAIDNTFINK